MAPGPEIPGDPFESKKKYIYILNFSRLQAQSPIGHYYGNAVGSTTLLGTLL